MKEWCMRRQVGKRLIVLMKVLIEWIELIIFHMLLGPNASLWNIWHRDEFQERQSISPSPQHSLKQLKEIIENTMKTDQGARDVLEPVDGEEVLDQDNSSSVLSTVLNTINNKYQPFFLDEAVRLLNNHRVHQSTDDHVPGQKYLISGLPGTVILAHLVWTWLFIVRRWVWYADMPGALVVDETGLGITITSVAAAILC